MNTMQNTNTIYSLRQILLWRELNQRKRNVYLLYTARHA